MGKQITLQGLTSETSNLPKISASQLHTLEQKEDIWCVLELFMINSSPEQADLPPAITELITEFSCIFDKPTGLPPPRSHFHTIPLIPGAQPFKLRPYRYSPAQKDEIEQQVQELLRNGMIQESSSPFASPVLLVKKKTGEWRLCVDYRRLNALTIKNSYPMPIMEEFLDELAGALWFSSLDLRYGYHQILVCPADRFKTAFQTHNGHYEYKVMPYGVTGGPATFQHVMNCVLAPLLRKCVVVFIDDILIYSSSWEAHLQHIREVFLLLQQHQFKVKLSKCTFAQQQVHYLGHVISKDGVATDPKKVMDIQNWPTPQSVREVRGFLGLAGYYRKFVKNFGLISKPLTNLLKKGELFVWTSIHDEAFLLLKQAWSTTPVLALPDFSKTFVIETDASDKGVGAVLLQESHPIAYISRALGPKNQMLSTYEKECLAILLAVDHWRSYLHHAEFVIKTDQKSLTHLDDQRLSTPWQHKALTKLMGLKYRIVYNKGVENTVADALSRVTPHNKMELISLSCSQPEWLDTISHAYAKFPETAKLLAALTIHKSCGDFVLQEGLIKVKGKILVPPDFQLQQLIITALHASPVGGHSGAFVTYQKVKQVFVWTRMKAMIKEFVANCQVCQQAKSERVKYPGLLQPLPVPEFAWQVITMDFIEGLPSSHSYNCIMVIVDKFSKYAHFVPLSHPFTAYNVALAFMEHVFKLHGLPESIISDRDKVFTSTLWKELFRLAGTKLQMSSAYHPQTDGQTERVNQCLEGYLRCFVHSCPNKWKDWLSLAEFWYNTSYHSSLVKTPFEILYGQQPRHLGIDVVEACSVPDLQDWLSQRKLMVQLLQQQLVRVQQRQKHQADKHRSERNFDVGDWVFLKLQPYVQSSLQKRANHKLAFKYFGPYQILEKIGQVAYKLSLPDSTSIHPVFHVSLLKKAVGNLTQVSDTLPVQTDALQFPAKVLDRRVQTKDHVTVSQVLVQWSSWPPSLATWEDEAALRAKFPVAPAWGASRF